MTCVSRSAEPVDPSIQPSLVSVAIRNQQYKKALKMIRAGAEFSMIEKDGFSNLELALAPPINIRLIQELIARSNVDTLNYCQPGRVTALYRAAFEENATVVELLVQAGARLEETDATGQTPLVGAVKGGYWLTTIPRIEKIRRFFTGQTNSSRQVHLGHMRETVRVLVRLKANVNQVDRDGCPLLQWHATKTWPEWVDLETVSILIKNGAAPVVRTGLTPDELPEETAKINHTIQKAVEERDFAQG